MKRTAFQLLVVSSAVFLLTAAQARTRPHYGDSLRGETHTVVMSGDNSPDALVGLVFETLVTIDDSGRAQPALATSWTSSNGGSRWEFALRRGVTFHDASPFTATSVVQSLSKLSNQSWRVRAGNDSVTFESETPLPNLPALLSLSQYAIASVAQDGSAIGTGPFRLDKRSGPLFSLKANDDYWGGRPFVDSLELLASRSPHDQMSDFSYDRADVVEVAPDQLRRAQQDRVRVDISHPSDTLFLVFDSAKPGLRDLRLRQAISVAIDRTAIHDVIFQHQGEIASGLLPNWLSGYEFLFPSDHDIARGRQLRMEVGQVPPITIGYDPSDPAERLIAERVALNVHDIGINLQAEPASPGTRDLRIRRLALPSLDPAAALIGMIDRLGIQVPSSSTPLESQYANERAALQIYTAIPLAHLPRVTALKDRVRNWVSSPDGEWRLDQVWLAPRNMRVEVHP